MQIQQSHALQGLNQDDDTRYTQPGSYRFAQNVRISSTDNGKRSAAQVIKGNTDTLNYKVWDGNSYISGSPPSGDNICIGVKENRETNSVFCFVFNSLGEHTIYQHRTIEGDSLELLRTSTLNFDKDRLITGSAYNNNILYWTDGENPIRQIDILSSKNLSTPIVEDQISFAKIAPSIPPTISAVELATVDTDALKEHTYIIGYRYIYNDNSTSPISPISLKSISLREDVFGDTLSVNNELTISIDYPTSNVTDLISHAEIMVKRSQTENFKVIQKIPSSESSCKFTNNGFDYTLDSLSSSKFSESIPRTSKALTIAKDKIILGNNLEDYDAVELNNSTIEGLISLNDPNDNRETVFDNQSFNSYRWGVMFFDKFRRNVGVSPIKNVSSNTSLPVTLNSKDQEEYNLYYRMDLSGDTPPSWATHYSIVRTANIKKSTFFQGYIESKNIGKKEDDTEERKLPGQVRPIPGSALNPSKRLLEGEGATFEDILSVGDKIRLGTRQKVYTVASIISDTFLTVNEDLTSTDLQFVDYYRVGEGTSILDSNITVIDVDITQMVDLGLGYNFNQGDRAWIPMLNLDAEVISQSGNTLRIKWSSENQVFNTKEEQYKTLLIELYTPTEVNDSDIYYETGLTYPITNGSFSNPIIELKEGVGDRFTRGRVDFEKAKLDFSDQYLDGQLTLETPNFNNRGFIVNNLGRVSVAILDANETTRNTSIRFSNSFVANTKVNGLSEFEALNEETLPTEIGSIEKLIIASNVQAEGSVMLTVANNEIVSVYLQEAIYKDTSGSTTVAVTDKFIGAFNILQKGLGTYNPESVYQIDGRVYGYDSKKGVVWRYAQDGLSRLSDRGMQTYFFDKGVPMYKDTANSRAYGSFDYFNGEYVLSLGKPTDSSMETIAYSENVNLWTTFYDYKDSNGDSPEMFGSLNNSFYSILNGVTYLHDSNETRNFIYDRQTSSKVTVVGNVNPDSIKIPQHIEQDSDLPWSDVKIETDRGQETNMNSNHFRTYENIHCTNILRDINSKALQAPQVAIIHGDRLRDKTFKITVSTDGTVENALYNMKVFYSESKR